MWGCSVAAKLQIGVNRADTPGTAYLFIPVGQTFHSNRKPRGTETGWHTPLQMIVDSSRAASRHMPIFGRTVAPLSGPLSSKPQDI